MQTIDINTLRAFTQTLVDAIWVGDGTDAMPQELYDMEREIIGNANRTGLRHIISDLSEDFFQSLSPREQKDLNQKLKAAFGFDLWDLNQKRLARIDKVLAAGKIRNEAEYRLLLGRAEEIYDTPDQRTTMEAINRLLATHERMMTEKGIYYKE